jgi:seryl-tRNA synthetase
MLDINFIRDNSDIVKEALQKRGADVDLNQLLTVDEERRQKLQLVESLRAEQNAVTKNIATAESAEIRNQLVTEMRGLKEDIQSKEEDLKKVMEEWQQLMLRVPNIPDMSVPEGKSEEDNVELAAWGEKPQFDFEPKDHIQLMTNLDMVDFERGTKVHGFRGYFLKNDGVELQWALWNYARKFFGEKNFNPMTPPVVVRKQYLYGTGHLPGDADDIFQTQDDDYLAGTSEISLMAYHSDEILKKEELPKRYLGFSPCYRREAGSHGKDTKGLVRVHEFYKLEQLILCEASHEESVKFHEEINRNFEEFLESLGLPYRKLIISTSDLKDAQVKSYDTEAWVASQNAYRELSSASYYHDFQSRRFNIRYKDEEGKTRFVHSLNCTAIATPRILVPLVEHYQNADGSITVPNVLCPYMGKLRIENPKP